MITLAALASIGPGYVILAFLPPILWLFIYLREDTHAEPSRLLLLTFFGGAASALVALGVQYTLLSELHPERDFLIFFGAIALIEEYVKYLAVRVLVLKRKDFNEPVDAMIYMITAGLGFAALENALFLFFQAFDGNVLFSENLLSGTRLSVARFLGANQLHALASAVVGFFLARAWFHPKRHHIIGLGILLASALHASFNYLIIVRNQLPGAIWYLVGLLGLALVIVLIDFQRLKKESVILESKPGGLQ